MRKISILNFVIISFILQISSIVYAKAANNIVGVDVDYWMSKLNADVRSTDLGLLGTKIDAINDLDVSNSENIISASINLNILRSHRFVVSYFALDVKGQKILSEDIAYKGVTYSAATDVSSGLKATLFEGYYEVMLLKQSFGEVGILLGAKYAQIEASLSNAVNGEQSESIDGGVPIIGVQAEVKLPAKFVLSSIAKGFNLSTGNIDFTVFDMQAALNYNFNRFSRACLGYRYFLIDGEDSNSLAKVVLNGPYAGVTFSF